MERRRQPRLNLPGHVWWNRLDEGYQQHGWLADKSQTGVAFITPFGKRLQQGETIAISANHSASNDPESPAVRFSVQRVEPYDEKLSLVACEVEKIRVAG